MTWEDVKFWLPLAGTSGLALAGFGMAWQKVRSEMATFCARLEALEKRHEGEQKDGEADALEMRALRISVDRHEVIVQTHDRHYHQIDKRLAVVEAEMRRRAKRRDTDEEENT